jgi:protein-S-isoprenylcysteine O-methyltransferase Ste14
MKLKVPPALLFLICVALMWGINWLIAAQRLEFLYQKWVAVLFIGFGVILGILGVFEFTKLSTTVNPHKPENTSKLVTSGVYRFSRNPMYAGLLFCLVGIGIYFGNLWSFLVIPVFIWYMNEFQVKPEEVVMRQKFGSDFKEYSEKVNRWI